MKNLLILFICLLTAGIATAQNLVKFNDVRLHYMGRTAITNSAAVLAWSGASVSINFTGSCIKFITKDENGDNYFNVILDGQVKGILHEGSSEQVTSTYCNLSPGRHTLELFKRTEWTKGKMFFYGFELSDDGKALPATPTKKRKIEFYGNSITCGYAIEDTTGKDRGTSPYENNYLSYAAITARHFNAEYSCIARSGIGVTVSWFPQIMPEMYNLLDATNPKSLWDFSKYTPDLVVVNLFQNDSWLVTNPNNDQFKARFGTTPPTPAFIISAYRDLIKSIRRKYPKAQIICALGSMDATKTGSPWPEYITKAVTSLADKKIYTHFFSFKNTPGHPSVKEQQAMADNLIAFIDQQIKW